MWRLTVAASVTALCYPSSLKFELDLPSPPSQCQRACAGHYGGRKICGCVVLRRHLLYHDWVRGRDAGNHWCASSECTSKCTRRQGPHNQLCTACCCRRETSLRILFSVSAARIWQHCGRACVRTQHPPPTGWSGNNCPALRRAMRCVFG